jgi:hypothetical protein
LPWPMRLFRGRLKATMVSSDPMEWRSTRRQPRHGPARPGHL